MWGGNGWLVAGRNRFAAGDELELIGPGMRQVSFRLGGARTEAGEPLALVQPNARVFLDLPPGARAGDLLRLTRDLLQNNPAVRGQLLREVEEQCCGRYVLRAFPGRSRAVADGSALPPSR